MHFILLSKFKSPDQITKGNVSLFLDSFFVLITFVQNVVTEPNVLSSFPQVV